MSEPLDLAELPSHFCAALCAQVTVARALKVSAVVGTILVVINQGDILLSGNWPPLWKIGLTYLVPYSVSSYSTATFIVTLSKSLQQNLRP